VLRRVRGARLLVATLLLPSPTPAAQSSQDPMAILKAAAQRYSGLRSYHFVSTIRITTADGSQERTMGQVLAGTAEGQTRYEMDTPLGRVVVVSDGKRQWTYFPTTDEYVVTAPGSGPLPNLGQEFIRSYAMVDSSLVRAEWLRAEDLSLGGTPVTCDVIRVEPQPGWPAVEDAEADRLWRAEWMNVPKTYWIDRQKRRILRVVATSKKGARQDTTYSVARVNEEFSPMLFTSPVPSGAKKVDSPP
jgi:outer membrane lipoprotein-sorting protein